MSDNPHQACPFVDCGSSDAFNWNDDGFGFCHSCGESYPAKKHIAEIVRHRKPFIENALKNALIRYLNKEDF